MDLSIVIPVRDEAGNVVPLAREIQGVLDDRCRYEIIFVDDGSRDATPAELQALTVAEPGAVRVLTHPCALGQSAALLTGARAASGRWLATLDGDGQNNPADLPAMLDAAHEMELEQGCWLVIGHRVRRQDHWLRRLSSRIANGARNAILRDGTPDTGCGLKLMPTDLLRSLPTFDHMHRFLPALVRGRGGAVHSTPVSHRPRVRGRSKYGVHNRLWVGLVDLAGVAWLIRRNQRLAP